MGHRQATAGALPPGPVSAAGIPMTGTSRKLAVFPAFHKVAGRRVVVVGGGHEAAAKIRLLSETKAEIVVYPPALDKETGVALIAAPADWRGNQPTSPDLAAAALVFAPPHTPPR